MYRVPYVDLTSQYQEDDKNLLNVLKNIASSGQFILREEVSLLEAKISKYLGVKYSIGVNSGTDALFLSLKAMGIKAGDEVITVSHTFIATISTIIHCDAVPVLVDINFDGNIDTSKIEKAITNRTKAIVIVHMNGRICDMEPIMEITEKYRLLLLEDAAQAFGATYKNKFAGSFGKCAAFSFHPMKVFGCMGDGGLITTNDASIYAKLLLFRNHGQETKADLVLFGYSSRLDNIQAAILLQRLEYFESELQKRQVIANFYIKELAVVPQIKLPSNSEQHRRDVFSSFVIQAEKRDALYAYLTRSGIEVAIHWNTPNHKHLNLDLDHFTLSSTEAYSKNIISLPIHPYLNDTQLNLVIEKIIEFYETE